jgi:hypothetical protein
MTTIGKAGLRIWAGVLAVSVTAGAAALAWADTKTHAAAGISIWVPDTWKSSTKEGVLTIVDPKDEAAVTFVVVPGDTLKAAIGRLDVELAKFAGDVKVKGKPEELKINGMDALAIKATGDAKGVPVGIMVVIVKTPTGKALLAVALVEAAKLDKHKPMFAEIFNSLKPL